MLEMEDMNARGICFNEDTMNLQFDDQVISKLRSCNLIPRSLSDFQVFVRHLTKDNISDDIVEEVWKKIYEGPCDEAKSNLMTTEVASEEQNASISMESEHKSSATLLNGNLIANSTSRSIDSSLKKVKKLRKSFSVHKISEQTEQSFSEIESEEFVSKCDEEVAEIGLESVLVEPLNYLKTSKNRKVTTSSSQLVFPYQKRVNKRKSNSSHINLPEQVKNDKIRSESGTDVRITSEKEDSASDCEVIELAFLNKSNLDVSNDNFNIDSGSYESDSEESVVLLSSNIKQEINHNINSKCPIHGNNSVRSPSSIRSETSCDRKGKTEYINSPKIAQYTNPANREQQEKLNRKKGKFEALKAEVKSLKSILVQFLTSLKSNSISECSEHSISVTSTPERDLGKKRKRSKTDKKSYCGKKRIIYSENKEKVSVTEKNKTSKLTDQLHNKPTSKKPTQHSKKKSSENYNELYESLPETIELDSYFEDLDSKKRKKFLWREVITDTLKTKPGMRLQVEKLKRIVIAKYCYYRGNVSKNTAVKFLKYLHSTAGVTINGDVAVYSNKQIPTASCKTKEKEQEQIVMKTVTKRKEYKMSRARVKK